MNASQQNIRFIAGKHFNRLRSTCKDGNWSHLAQSLQVDITSWELKCIAQRPDNLWLKPFLNMVRDENFVEFLQMSLKWDGENLNSFGTKQSNAVSENTKTRQYIAACMERNGFGHLVGKITAGVALVELKKIAVFGDPAWEEKLGEIIHDKEFATILIEDMKDIYLERRREFEKTENLVC